MNLYLISQSVNIGYDTYDSAVVAGESEEDAKRIHPCSWSSQHCVDHDWAPPEDVTAKLLGKAVDSITEAAVICASFNAG